MSDKGDGHLIQTNSDYYYDNQLKKKYRSITERESRIKLANLAYCL